MRKRNRKLLWKKTARIEGKRTLQLTLDSSLLEDKQKLRTPNNRELSASSDKNDQTPQNKKIQIVKFGSTIEEDELALQIEFKLLPSKNLFSRIRRDLWFDEQRVNSVLIDISTSFGSVDEFILTPKLDLKGINAGAHSVKVELREMHSSGENNFSTMERIIEYLPQRKVIELKRVPTVKDSEGRVVTVLSDSEKEIYREIEEAEKKELISRRDEW